jgi:tetratricopeptide (TPR) repeat protein
MKKVTLAEALMVRKKYETALAKASKAISTFNRDLKQDVVNRATEAYEAYKKYQAALIDIKCVLDEASLPIRNKIYTLSELKGEIKVLGSINTTEYEAPNRYLQTDAQPIKHELMMTYEQVNSKVSALEAQIEELQTEINKFNYQTLVEINEMS